ncbi:PQQ-binding-like beta-propeller repeat protein [Pseudorhodobacter sp.]|uniref:outer membrane protein assembly factor BamB family protein n=1 Tax=Pseudorhodobacter sp. TaxID=1934400 RepID=UPI002648CB4C|nr:PQQ-binding-like beta-propeller repeat protein [Pseudorhodobacter sp.]MDN5786691.1 PQQ-like beta-propeller repeat protein [Pseudorhodobacter sp.]
MISLSDMRANLGKPKRAGLTVCLLAGALLLSGCEKELILTGERFNTRTPLEDSIPVKGEALPTDSYGQVENKSVPISLPAARSNAEWTHRADNPAHLMPNAALSASPTRIWSVNIGSGNSRKFRITAAPVVAAGRVYTMDSATVVSAVSTAGAKLWSVDLMPAGARGAVSGGGLAYGGGKLFASTGHAELVAVDPASGGVIWRQNLGAPAAGTPTYADGVVYVVGRDSTAWAINAVNGKVQWQLGGTPSVNGMIGAGGPAVAGGKVLFPFASGELVAAETKGGTRIWLDSIAGSRLGRGYTGVTDITGDPVIDGATTYVGNQSGRLSAVDTATGLEKWSAHEAAYGAVLPVGGSVFLISDEAKLVRLNANTGETIWEVDMPYYEAVKAKKLKAITAHYGPVLAGGRIVVASGDGVIRLFNPTNGALLGTVALPGGAASTPALAGGAMYVVSGNGQLHAFR